MAKKFNTEQKPGRGEYYRFSWEDYLKIKPFPHNPTGRVESFENIPERISELEKIEKRTDEQESTLAVLRNNESLVQHILAGKQLPVSEIVEHGKYPDVSYMMLAGHRRREGRKEAVRRGAKIENAEVIIRPLDNEAEMLAHTIAQKDLGLTEVQKAEVVGKFLGWGWQMSDIAATMSVSITTIQNYAVLNRGGIEIKNAVEDKDLPKGEAIEVIENSNGNLDFQKKAVEKAKEEKEKGIRTKTGRKRNNKQPKTETENKENDLFDLPDPLPTDKVRERLHKLYEKENPTLEDSAWINALEWALGYVQEI